MIGECQNKNLQKDVSCVQQLNASCEYNWTTVANYLKKVYNTYCVRTHSYV